MRTKIAVNQGDVVVEGVEDGGVVRPGSKSKQLSSAGGRGRERMRGGERLPVSCNGEDASNDGSNEDVVPVVLVIEQTSQGENDGTPDRSKDQDHLPHLSVSPGDSPQLQLGIEVEGQEEESSPGCVTVSRWEAL